VKQIYITIHNNITFYYIFNRAIGILYHNIRKINLTLKFCRYSKRTLILYRFVPTVQIHIVLFLVIFAPPYYYCVTYLCRSTAYINHYISHKWLNDVSIFSTHEHTQCHQCRYDFYIFSFTSGSRIKCILYLFCDGDANTPPDKIIKYIILSHL